MINKTMLTAGAAFLMLGFAATAQADESAYRVLEPVSVSGSSAAPVSYRSLPLDRSWANLSSSDVELVRNQYEGLRAHEEPPFPAGGLSQLASELSALQRQQNLRGELQAMINVDAGGRVTAVTWKMTPAQGAESGGGCIEGVIITAEKRSATLQTTPAAVTRRTTWLNASAT